MIDVADVTWLWAYRYRLSLLSSRSIIASYRHNYKPLLDFFHSFVYRAGNPWPGLSHKAIATLSIYFVILLEGMSLFVKSVHAQPSRITTA